MDKKLALLSLAITIISGLSGVIALIETYPLLAKISFGILLFGICTFLFSRYIFGQLIIKRGFKTVMKKLKKKNFRPDVVLAFSRSGAIAAGTIAINLNIQQCVVITRVLKDRSSKKNHENRFEFESSVDINSKYFQDKNVLIMFFTMFTNETIKLGLNYLENQKLRPKSLMVASLSVSESAVRSFPDVIYSYKTNQPDKYLRSIPWVLDEYPFI